MNVICKYPPICSPLAKVLSCLLAGEKIRDNAPGALGRSPILDIIESLENDFGWMIYHLNGPEEELVYPRQFKWVEYSLDDELIVHCQPRADKFRADVSLCCQRKCPCAKGAKK